MARGRGKTLQTEKRRNDTKASQHTKQMGVSGRGLRVLFLFLFFVFGDGGLLSCCKGLAGVARSGDSGLAGLWCFFIFRVLLAT